MKRKVLCAALGIAMLVIPSAQAALSTGPNSVAIVIEQPLVKEAGLMRWPAYRACMMNQIRTAMDHLAGRHSIELILDMSAGICIDMMS